MSEGHFRCYQEKNFSADRLELISNANGIIAEYESKGFSITLRQLYYQFVARGLFENVVANYNKLGAAISEGRIAGLVSWTAIEDRGRNLMGLRKHSSPASALRELHDSYLIDKWRDQPCRPEVWVEKQALEGVIGEICNKLNVDFFAIKGYNSQSEQWRAGQRFARYVNKGQRPIVLHLGDHDPSGIDMTRDNQERLSMFAGTDIKVVRIALNMDQIEALNPPPNPAKQTDSRFAEYQARFGDESWELDALSPVTMHDIIERAVLSFRDEALWDIACAEQADHLETLQDLIETAEGEAA